MKRLLLVARGFPPHSDPTSYRWLRFANGLARRGWRVEVLTSGITPRREYFHPELIRQIAPEIAVHRAHPGWIEPAIWRRRLEKSGETQGLGNPSDPGAAPSPRFRPTHLIRDLDQRLAPLKIPDPTYEWIAPGILAGLRLLARRPFDLVVSSAAPFSSHVVAHHLAAWTRTPWIADFSDPFADNPFNRRPPWRIRLDAALENGWFDAMAGAIVPVPEMKRLFHARHPGFAADRIHVIPYGFDPELYATTAPARFEGFTIVHTGTFYAGLRDPRPFFEALGTTRDLPLHVVHAGVLEADYAARLRELGVADRFRVLGLLSREAIAPLQLGASCLLLIGNRGGLQLPGKLLDYLGARRPILALRNDTHDIAAGLVAARNAGPVVPNEPAAIADAIRTLFDWWRDGSLDGRFTHDGAPEFTWESLEDDLDRTLTAAAGRSRHPAASR